MTLYEMDKAILVLPISPVLTSSAFVLLNQTLARNNLWLRKNTSKTSPALSPISIWVELWFQMNIVIIFFFKKKRATGTIYSLGNSLAWNKLKNSILLPLQPKEPPLGAHCKKYRFKTLQGFTVHIWRLHKLTGHFIRYTCFLIGQSHGNYWNCIKMTC